MAFEETADLIGTKRGKVTVLRFNRFDSSGMEYWDCHCDNCHNVFEKTTSHFRNEGFVQKCPVCDPVSFYTKKNVVKKTNYSDINFRPVVTNGREIIESKSPSVNSLVGRTISNVKVLQDTYTSVGQTRIYNCECLECGEYVQLTARFITGNTVGCGCKGFYGHFNVEDKKNQSNNGAGPFYPGLDASRARRVSEMIEKKRNTVINGYTLKEPTGERHRGCVVWQVETPDGDIDFLTTRAMRKAVHR